MSADKHSQMDSLLEELISLMAEYEEAIKNDDVLSVKKELRLRIKALQTQIQDLRSQTASAN